jgi:hypothetical protein
MRLCSQESLQFFLWAFTQISDKCIMVGSKGREESTSGVIIGRPLARYATENLSMQDVRLLRRSLPRKGSESRCMQPVSAHLKGCHPRSAL